MGLYNTVKLKGRRRNYFIRRFLASSKREIWLGKAASELQFRTRFPSRISLLLGSSNSAHKIVSAPSL